MARSKKSKNKLFQSDNIMNLILGAIIVVILGLLVANFISKRNQQDIDDGTQTDITSQQDGQSLQDYKVKANDSLSKISQSEYGSFDYWPVLARVNKIANPNVIHTDSNLKIPSKAEAGKVLAEMTQTSYDVVSGDTLFMIAERLYGNGSKWTTIAKANKVGRLPNGNPLILAGSKLTIPR